VRSGAGRGSTEIAGRAAALCRALATAWAAAKESVRAASSASTAAGGFDLRSKSAVATAVSVAAKLSVFVALALVVSSCGSSAKPQDSALASVEDAVLTYNIDNNPDVGDWGTDVTCRHLHGDVYECDVSNQQSLSDLGLFCDVVDGVGADDWEVTSQDPLEQDSITRDCDDI
jgi:hypothetical protein